jgi:hypothetical protein
MEVGSPQIRQVKICFAEIRRTDIFPTILSPQFAVSSPPRIPDGHALLEDIEMLLIGHIAYLYLALLFLRERGTMYYALWNWHWCLQVID